MAKILLDGDVDLDEYVRKYLEDVVQKHVRAILEHQLKGIIETEIARLRLTSVDAPTLGDVIKDSLEMRMESIAFKAASETLNSTFSHIVTLLDKPAIKVNKA